MIYAKGKLADGQQVAVPINEHTIFCKCPVCGEETKVEYDVFADIVNEGGLEETAQYCDPCSENYRSGKVKPFKRIK